MAADGNFLLETIVLVGGEVFSALISMKHPPSRNQLAKRQMSRSRWRCFKSLDREKPAHHKN